jgi:hypothetical protein
MGTAVVATVDKTEDLKKFSDVLGGLYSEFGSLGDVYGLSEFSKNMSKEVNVLQESHSKKLGKLKKMGLPILKQHELGMPEEVAKKLPVDFEKKIDIGETEEGIAYARKKTKGEKVSGSMYDLLQYTKQLEGASKKSDLDPSIKSTIKKHIDEDLQPYIESIRYPFTGESSIQPYKPKLIKHKKGDRELGKNVLTVPGMPDMDFDAFDNILAKVKSKRSELEEGRTIAFGKGDIDTANKLTQVIDKLNVAISAVIPKYIAHRQKLDIDGDTIEVHTAKNIEARKDIKRHFDSLSNEVDSVGSVFRDSFTYKTIQKPTGDYPLAEMAKAYEK